jgi:hypothetical protein
MAKSSKVDKLSELRVMGPEPEPFILTGWSDMAGVLNWYNYYYSNDDAIKFLTTYLRETNYLNVSINTIKAVPPWSISLSLMFRARMLSRGFLFPEEDMQRFTDQLDAAIREATVKNLRMIQDKVVKFPTLTAKDREREQIGEVESALDEFRTNWASDFSAYDWFRKMGTAPNAVKRLAEKYQSIIDELNDVEFQRELIRPMDNRQKRVYIKFIQKIIADCNAYTNTKKAEKTVVAKPRKIKEKSADQITRGVKFKKEDPALKLVSIAPTAIIGAMVLLLFNTKHRNLHYYVAADEKGLAVTGSKLLNVDETLQSMKKLRKPEEILPDIMKANKHGIVRLMKNIRGVEHKGNGRIDQNMIILRVIK